MNIFSRLHQGRVADCLSPDGFFHGDTSQQQNTHIGELRDIHYPWHPWSDRKVRVHATLVKRGRAVGRCSLEDVQPFRILEVPLWMMDPAVAAKSGLHPREWPAWNPFAN